MAPPAALSSSQEPQLKQLPRYLHLLPLPPAQHTYLPFRSNDPLNSNVHMNESMKGAFPAA